MKQLRDFVASGLMALSVLSIGVAVASARPAGDPFGSDPFGGGAGGAGDLGYGTLAELGDPCPISCPGVNGHHPKCDDVHELQCVDT